MDFLLKHTIPNVTQRTAKRQQVAADPSWRDGSGDLAQLERTFVHRESAHRQKSFTARAEKLK